MDLFEKTKERLIRYAKINTRSNEESTSIPSTQCQFDLLNMLVEELEDIGLEDVRLNPANAFVTATLAANTDEAIPTIGFIAHVDTADFNAEGVSPQLHPDYDGQSICLNEDQGIYLSPEQFPNLKNYQGQTLITTDGTTLLGADDKAGIAEIMTAMEYLKNNPKIKHGQIKVAFGPDEEIGRGADHFDVEDFKADFAYTMDGGPVGELEYESFNAAAAKVSFKGVNVHPGTAKGLMVNAVGLAHDFIQALPKQAVPEKTEGRQGFYHVLDLVANVENAQLSLIVRDFDRKIFESMKVYLEQLVIDMNQRLGYEAVTIDLYDQYYNMVEIIEKDMYPVDLARQAMVELDIRPIIHPIRGGTDGSKLSFMGLPTPNIFAGGENMHGRYEYVAVESMVKACQVIIKIAELANLKEH